MDGLKLRPTGRAGRDAVMLEKLDEILREQKKTNEYIKDLIMSKDDVEQAEKATTDKKPK